MGATTMSPAKRIATAAITAVLLGTTPGLAAAAAPPTALPSQQTGQWHRFRIYPPPNEPAMDLDVNGSGVAVVSTPDPGNEHQQWNLDKIDGKQFIRNRATGTCLTAPNDTLDPVTVQACDGNNPNQRWDVHYVRSGQVEISPWSHLSLALTGGAQFGSDKALLRPYAEKETQEWYLRSA
ncbi:RICIN domain-containing protein [Kitasatospora sp. NPDC058184]|uniref:RICIN domain-containing protein n=1 Tax=Kitasatospora sp. NPDC058184 TaxID=3346370 RepID=UPI0036DCCAE3